MITPKEIEMKEFSRTKVGGYKPEEVDEFLDRILADYESLIEERESLTKRIAYLNDKIDKARDDQDKMRSTVVTNQKSYDDMMGAAKKKADKIVADAQDYARRLIETAKEEADHQQQVKTQLTAEVESFKSRLLSIYENHVKLISTIPVFKKDDEEYESGTLEMLKVATSDVSASDSSYDEDLTTSPELDDTDSDDDIDIPSDDSTILMPSVHVDQHTETPRARRNTKKYDDEPEFDDDDDDEIDDTSANDKQIKGLFASEKKKKSLFGSGKKKTSIFSRYNEDDDDDDEDDEDDE